MVFVAALTLATVSAFFGALSGHAAAEHEHGFVTVFATASLLVAAVAVAVARFA